MGKLNFICDVLSYGTDPTARVFGILLILAVSALDCAAMQCPFNGTLGFRPLDPIIFAGAAPFTVWCTISNTNHAGVDKTWLQKNIFFRCNLKGMVISPLPTGDQQVDNVTTNPSVYANITTELVDKGPCICEVQGQPSCQGFQFVRVEEPLPPKLNFSCICYQLRNITCWPMVPKFVYTKRVRTTLKVKQVGSQHQSSVSCSPYNSCVYTEINKFGALAQIFTFNMSVELNYDLGKSEYLTTSSDWMLFHVKFNVKLDAVKKAWITNIENRSFSISWSWDDNTLLSMDKVVWISYTHQDGQEFVKTLNVTKHPLSISASSKEVTTLSNLSPYTKYKICMKTRLETSNIWSDPTYLVNRTHSDVPEQSPLTSPGAFTIISTSMSMIYWQKLQESDWNSPVKGRKYIVLKYNESSHWEHVVTLNWTEYEAKVKVTDPALFGIVAANELGWSKNMSVIKVPGATERIPGPTELQASYDISRGLIEIKWQPEKSNEWAKVAWCKQGKQTFSCMDSIQWENVANARDQSFSLSISNFTEARNLKYGVSVSKTVDSIVLYSGFVWQTCIHVIEGDSTNLQGNCESTKTKTTGGEDFLIIVSVFVPMGILLLLICLILFVRKIRSRLKRFKPQTTTLEMGRPKLEKKGYDNMVSVPDINGTNSSGFGTSDHCVSTGADGSSGSHDNTKRTSGEIENGAEHRTEEETPSEINSYNNEGLCYKPSNTEGSCSEDNEPLDTYCKITEST